MSRRVWRVLAGSALSIATGVLVAEALTPIPDVRLVIWSVIVGFVALVTIAGDG